MDIGDAIAPELEPELPDRLEEGQTFDVADRAADLAQHEVGVADALEDEFLDAVGDVGDHLHGAAEIVAVPLLREHARVHLARGDAVRAPRRHPGEALVMPEVEIGLGAVLGDVHLAVLIGTHGPRIDVEVGIELAQPDRIASRLQERADGRRGQSLAQGRHHAARNEDEARHGLSTIGENARGDNPGDPAAGTDLAIRVRPQSATGARGVVGASGSAAGGAAG